MATQTSSDAPYIRRWLRFWIFIVVAAYFGLAIYWAYIGLTFSIGLTTDHYVYQLVSKGPWWWAILYYGSEGITDVAACVFRAIAGVFALYAAIIFLIKKENSFSLIREKVNTALLFEAIYFLSFIPAVIAAFAYNSTNQYLYYFDHTPGLILLYVTAIPCLAMVLVIPPLLLKLRKEIKQRSPREDIIKWSCLTGVAYLFVPFWLSYSMSWLANMVPYSRSQSQFGFTFLLKPINLTSFILTVFGLFLLATFALLSTLPAIKKKTANISLKRLGIITTAFGAYFVFSFFYYYLTGQYAAHPNVWYEVIGPLHNVNLLWCITYLFLGLALLTSRKSKD